MALASQTGERRDVRPLSMLEHAMHMGRRLETLDRSQNGKEMVKDRPRKILRDGYGQKRSRIDAATVRRCEIDMERGMTRHILNGNRSSAIEAVRTAPAGYVCEVKERTRTSDQNALLHALLQDISRQAIWAGKKRSVEDWKALMVSAHRMALQQAGEVVPGLEGEFVQLRKSTTAMGVKELGSLIDYLIAWAMQNDVRLSAPERQAA